MNSALGDEDTTTGDRNTYDATDGIRLVDAKNRKRYIAASDEKGDCLCSRELSSLTVEPGDSYGFYTTFAAPPAGVTALDVTVPHFGSIPHVPVV